MRSCLMLNATFEPLDLTPLSDAIVLVLEGKAEIVEQDGDRLIRSQHLALPAPAVIRLKKFVRVPQRMRRKVSNTILAARDAYRCAYCGRHETELGPREMLNRDHVIPRARGGADTWENVVLSCTTCNGLKGSRLPHECGMFPKVKPAVPEWVTMRWTVRSLTELQLKYIALFFGEATVQELIRRERARTGRRKVLAA